MPANPSSSARRAPRRGFTLVELLMVVVIIGLLMAILLPAIGRARLTAQRAAITAEISQLNAAMAQYASNHNEYPPNYLGKEWGADPAYGNKHVVRHVRKAYPRYAIAVWEDFQNKMLTATGRQIDTMSPAEALVFWLGGFANANNEMQGFSKNPLDPFQPVGAPGRQGTTPLFDFDANRLADVNNNGFLEYYPANTNLRAPYLYFGALSDGSYAGAFVQNVDTSKYPNNPGASGVARPYRTDAGGFVNPKTCQIIWSGFDFDYGADSQNKRFPSGANYGTGDYDNQTNFVTGILEDSLP